MKLPFTTPPKHLCLLRLSAIGDICHVLPIVRTIQKNWPETRLTWIIGKTEHALVYDIPDIEFIIFDKSRHWKAYGDIRRKLKNHHFDALLHMQMSLRASLISLMVKTPIKLGFDKKRAKDMQWLFSNYKIDYQPRQHVIDSFFCFTQALGISDKQLIWDIPVPENERQFAARYIGNHKTLIISPCSSMAYRNWHAKGYAEIADYATERYGLNVILTGGKSAIEQQYGDEITRLTKHKPVNLIGQTTLKQLFAIISQATVVISPDAGAAHLGTAANTPVIGLYATTNPDRARPYCSKDYVVNKYPQAIQKKFQTSVENIAWGTRVKDEGTMNEIKSEDIVTMLDKLFSTSD